MRLHISIGNEQSNEWLPVATLDPDQTSANGTLSWTREIFLPSGEALDVGAIYAPSNNGVNIVISKGGAQLAQVGGFKLKPTTFDPNIVVLTPDGAHVSIMLGV
jgi:hypothetical protein